MHTCIFYVFGVIHWIDLHTSMIKISLTLGQLQVVLEMQFKIRNQS